MLVPTPSSLPCDRREGCQDQECLAYKSQDGRKSFQEVPLSPCPFNNMLHTTSKIHQAQGTNDRKSPFIHMLLTTESSIRYTLVQGGSNNQVTVEGYSTGGQCQDIKHYKSFQIFLSTPFA